MDPLRRNSAPAGQTKTPAAIEEASEQAAVTQELAAVTQEPAAVVEEPAVVVEEPAAVVTVPLPTRMAIPACSVCKIVPGAFPVYTCETCWGKTIVCQACGATLHTNPSNPHKNHKFRIWSEGLWYDARQMYLKSNVPPSDQYGPEWGVKSIESLVLGNNLMAQTNLIEFYSRPSGALRIALMTVPPGQWEVSLQITTWASPTFGEAEVKLLRFSKKLSVQTGATAIGYVDAFIGIPPDAAKYLENVNENPTTVSVLGVNFYISPVYPFSCNSVLR